MSRIAVLMLGALFLASLSFGAPSAAAAGSAGMVAARSLQASTDCDGGDGVYLYDNTRYRGRCVKLTEDVADLSTLGFNNVASSIRFIGDFSATLFVNQNYGGAASTFLEDDSDLGNNTVGSNTASSVRVRRGTGGVEEEYRCDGGEGVYLYSDRQYGGRCAKVTRDVSDLSAAGFNNSAASIRIVGDFTAVLFVDQNYGGTSSTFTDDDPDLSNNAIRNGRASSVRVQRGPGAGLACDGGEGVYLYEHPNFQGRCVKFTADQPDLRVVGFDDTASSVRILGDYTVTLFRDLSGTGIASAFSRDDNDLSNDAIGDNQATSLQVRRGGPPPEGGCGGGEGVYLYEHPNFQGRCVRLTADEPDLRVIGFDDTISSVRIVGNYTAILFRDLSGTGIASTFSQDDNDLSNDAIGDNQATSLQVRRGAAGGTNCDGSEGVYLYEHPRFQGRCIRFTADVPDLRVYGFDDLVSSVGIVGNYRLIIFRDLSGTGIASTYDQDDSDLSNDGIGDNQATSIQVRRR